MNEQLRFMVRTCVLAIIKTSFINPSKHSEREGFALLLSKYFEWSPADIMEVASHALEDSNCHTFKSKLDKFVTEELN